MSINIGTYTGRSLLNNIRHLDGRNKKTAINNRFAFTWLDVLKQMVIRNSVDTAKRMKLYWNILCYYFVITYQLLDLKNSVLVGFIYLLLFIYTLFTNADNQHMIKCNTIILISNMN